jgi:Na+/H+ antiporter
MEYIIEVVIGLFIAIVFLGVLAKKLKVPYPIVLVIGGLGLSFVPLLPKIVLDPDLVFLTILPPILYFGGYFTPLGSFKKNLGPISQLAIGLVITTTIFVGLFGYYFVALPITAAFALGAIISPPDAIAATSITSRLKVQHNVVSIIEGESLVNDASALIILNMVLLALTTGAFSYTNSLIDFFAVSAGGIGIGFIIGVITEKLIKYLSDAPLACTISLITPYITYILAENLGLSGVLAAVTAGIYHGWHLPATVEPLIKLEMSAVWRMFIFLLNGAAFILIGLQLPIIVEDLDHYELDHLITLIVLLNLLVIFIRFMWVFISIYLPTMISKKLKNKNPHLDWRNCLIISWCGMRGVVSLAAALSLPILINNQPFEHRSLIIILTFSVIFVTLVLQGLTLPFIIKKLFKANVDEDLFLEANIRMKTSEAAIEKLKQLSKEFQEDDEIFKNVMVSYEDKFQKASMLFNQIEDLPKKTKSSKLQKLQLELLNLERNKVIQLRNRGIISNNVARRILVDLDFEAARIHNVYPED